MTDILYENWQPVIGLEIHAQLSTKTKLFGRAKNQFGAEPNTNIDEVDTGQPGTLPVLNKQAVVFAIKLGLALKAEICRFSSFDRKSYFYPDSPRNFQITQFYHPILKGGVVTCEMGGETRHFNINRAHLEDDSGILKHFSSFTGIDYNRAGTPLIEIVSEPTLYSPKEAVAYATSLRATMQYLGIANCNMEEGGMRMDVNVSVRLKRETKLRPKIEIKNLNSFHNMELAIEAEIRRQIQAYTLHPEKDFEHVIEPGTYRFDLATKKTVIMRKKEKSYDYRYFPEPDLLPIVLSDSMIEEITKTLPELPHTRYLRYVSYGISKDSAAILVNDKYVADFFEEALIIAKNPVSLCNWLIVEFFGRLKEKGMSLKNSKLSSLYIGKLMRFLEEKTITGPIAKLVADEMMAFPEKDCEEIIQNNPQYKPLQESKELEHIILEVLKEHPQAAIDAVDNPKVFGFLVGQVMKKSKGQASPQIVNELLQKKLIK